MSGSNAPQVMQLTGAPLASVGNLAQNYAADAAGNPPFPVGMVVQGIDPLGCFGEYVFLKSVASTIVGSVVTFDGTGKAALIAAGVNGPCAVSLTIFDSTAPYAWFGYTGTFPTDTVANTALGSQLGRETTDGKVGDGFATGDQIQGAVNRLATTAAAVVNAQFSRPFVGIKTT